MPARLRASMYAANQREKGLLHAVRREKQWHMHACTRACIHPYMQVLQHAVQHAKRDRMKLAIVLRAEAEAA